MKNTLHAQDFKLESLDGNSYKYFSYEFENDGEHCEITIEPRGNGFDVAHYDGNGILCGDRFAINPQITELPHDMFRRACRVADMFYGMIVGRPTQPSKRYIDVVL